MRGKISTFAACLNYTKFLSVYGDFLVALPGGCSVDDMIPAVLCALNANVVHFGKGKAFLQVLPQRAALIVLAVHVHDLHAAADLSADNSDAGVHPCP